MRFEDEANRKAEFRGFISTRRSPSLFSSIAGCGCASFQSTRKPGHRVPHPGMNQGMDCSLVSSNSLTTGAHRRGNSPTNCFPFRPGFTILELIIVLGLLVAILGITWPSINRRIQKSKLKQAALQLKEEIADARSAAIKEGQAWELRFNEFSNRYQLGPSVTFHDSDRETPGEKISIGRSVKDRNVDDQQKSEKSPFESEFDSSILFTTHDANRLAPTKPLGQPGKIETLQIGPSTGKLNEKRPANAVIFNPEGRSLDFKFVLMDRISKFGIEVQIRGLTGQVEMGGIIRITAPLEDPRQKTGDTDLGDELELEN